LWTSFPCPATRWSADGGVYIVTPERGRSDLSDPWCQSVGTFRTLREALESVCRTIDVTLPAA
jgi:hypothetical protein